ncbi:hypothetical protein Back11_55140 [Paenibacillus baekrokdamisoli]|uniref:Uncharacterized protein n=1 Tax=Paenibacillus baekrokdamisoli TaxID=1712516 RepID=A0A3G9JMB4_9BACL|nr:cupredoxin domain-containing protein [Paenibacillus baekrokdamisoli]MBB3071849.1 cytochrome c oxidase subunit 2 [Paenibacillus baekrokdamisoli]BBH24169.1 hypothetical protein Back11_55140 [Paenibacillus baekrokdamisoli]
MKKQLAIASIALATVLSLSACGSNSTNTAATNANTTTPSNSNTATSNSTGGTEDITITAKNFEFDQKEIHIKKGDKVKLTFKNAAGSHGIEIPDYNVKLTSAGTTEFTADKAGTFEFNCAVMCGGGHSKMTGKIIVE